MYRNDWFLSSVLEVLRESGIESSDLQTSQLIDSALSTVIHEGSDMLSNTLKSRSSSMLKERRSFARNFNKRLYQKWKKPLDLLEMLLQIAYEAGDEFNKQYRDKAFKTNDYLFDVLIRLHARACLTSSEILALLRSGFADGAHSRWRTLHEIAVISYFVRDQGQAVAERFLQYDAVDTYKFAGEYQQHCHRLGYEPLSDDELQILKEHLDNACNVYGRDFKRGFGWVPDKDKRSFKEIEEAVGLAQLRPYYLLASDNVHSGIRGLLFRLALVHGSQRETLLAGPSNYGLSDPVQALAISLNQITSCLLSTRQTIMGLIVIAMMTKLVEEICQASCQVQSQIEQEVIGRGT